MENFRWQIDSKMDSNHAVKKSPQLKRPEILEE
jgi:hypothetical protein